MVQLSSHKKFEDLLAGFQINAAAGLSVALRYTNLKATKALYFLLISFAHNIPIIKDPISSRARCGE